MKKIFKGFLILFILVIFTITNCSYVADSIEAGITNRASFSINGKYENGIVTVSWDKGRVDTYNEAFAGYEIYVTEQPDNEFVGYEILIGPYDMGQDIIERELRKTSATSISFYPVTLEHKGIYFFRVGIANWDKESKEARAGEDDDDESTTGWMPLDSSHYFHEYDESDYDQYDENLWFYINKTSLDSVSGSVMINIIP